MRWQTLMILGAGLLLPAMSCQEPQYKYEVSGIVRDTETQRPIDGVEISLEDHPEDGDFRAPTDNNGKFWGRYTLRESDFTQAHVGTRPKRTLLLSKAGYAAERIELDPMQNPQSGDCLVRVIVVAYLRPEL